MDGPAFDTVILAGGQAARMAGVDKPSLEVGGVPMLVAVASAAAQAGTARLVVVGPRRGGRVDRLLESAAEGAAHGLTWRRESPPGGGPLAALRCGIAAVSSPWLALLAADLPFLTGAWIGELLARSWPAGRSGAVLVDDDGRPQWLAGCWDTERLAARLAAYDGQSLGGLLDPLDPVLVASRASAGPPWLDCDDQAALAAARAAAGPTTTIGEA